MKYKIAVIEDNPKHLEDVRSLIDQRKDLLDVAYATNLNEALNLFKSQRYEGVLSDALFPKEVGGVELPSGIDVIDYAMENRFPFTIVTSTYHHAGKTEPVNQRSRNSGMELIDNNLPGAEASTKRWADGLATLVYLIDLDREGKLKYGIVKSGGSDSKHIGMIGEDGGIKFSLPPYEENALDEVKKKLRL